MSTSSSMCPKRPWYYLGCFLLFLFLACSGPHGAFYSSLRYPVDSAERAPDEELLVFWGSHITGTESGLSRNRSGVGQVEGAFFLSPNDQALVHWTFSTVSEDSCRCVSPWKSRYNRQLYPGTVPPREESLCITERRVMQSVCDTLSSRDGVRRAKRSGERGVLMSVNGSETTWSAEGDIHVLAVHDGRIAAHVEGKGPFPRTHRIVVLDDQGVAATVWEDDEASHHEMRTLVWLPGNPTLFFVYRGDLYRLNLVDGTEDLLLADEWPGEIVPSPDGRWLAIHADEIAGEYDGWISMPANGGPISRLGTGSAVTWRDDSERLALVHLGDCVSGTNLPSFDPDRSMARWATCIELVDTMRADGSDRQQVTTRSVPRKGLVAYLP